MEILKYIYIYIYNDLMLLFFLENKTTSVTSRSNLK